MALSAGRFGVNRKSIDYKGNVKSTANSKIYSTDEIDTGDIWVDGKHIYEKSYYKELSDTPITSNTTIDSSLKGNSIDVLSIDGVYSSTSAGNWNLFRYYLTSSSTYVTPVIYEEGGLKLNVTSSQKAYGYAIIVRYTKKEEE